MNWPSSDLLLGTSWRRPEGGEIPSPLFFGKPPWHQGDVSQPPAIPSEQVDDLPRVIRQLREMGVDTIIDEVLPVPHGNRQGLSYGQLAVGFLDYILTECDHRLFALEEFERLAGWRIEVTNVPARRLSLSEVLHYRAQWYPERGLIGLRGECCTAPLSQGLGARRGSSHPLATSGLFLDPPFGLEPAGSSQERYLAIHLGFVKEGHDPHNSKFSIPNLSIPT